MLQEIEKIIDVESANEFFQKNFEGIEEFNLEILIQKIASTKVLDFFIAVFRPEYTLQGMWHEQEVNQLRRKIERCITIEQKKAFLETKLNEQEILFSNNDYFDLLEDFKDDTVRDLFKKVNQLKSGFYKTSRWYEADEDDKVFLALVDEIPDKLPSIEILENITLQKVRNLILTRPILYNFFRKLMRLKRGEIPPSKLIMDIVKDIFSIYYATQLNVFLREEYKKLIPKSDYHLVEVIETPDEISTESKIEWKGTQKELAELFVELHRKKWINEIPYKLIKQCFTKSDTIEQVLKPTQDSKTKEKNYEGIYTTAYKPRFDAIRQNPKKQ